MTQPRNVFRVDFEAGEQARDRASGRPGGKGVSERVPAAGPTRGAGLLRQVNRPAAFAL